MCRRRWNLWFLTVTIGVWVICFNGRTTIAIAHWTNPNETKNAAPVTPGIATIINNTRNSSASEPYGIRPTPPASKTTTWSTQTVGYAAEWEYEGGDMSTEESDDPFPTKKFSAASDDSLSSGGGNVVVPSKRVGPGSWLGANGSWWMFGGQGPVESLEVGKSSSKRSYEGLTTSKSNTIRFLSDLWLYDSNSEDGSQEGDEKAGKLSWRLVYSPRSDSASPISSYPDNIAFPVLCGSESNGHLAVFGGGSNPRGDSRAHNSPFVEDNIVWLYDMPKSKQQQELLKKKKKRPRNSLENSMESSAAGEVEVEWTYQEPWNGTEGLWTSYICCDACLPDGNTTLEFCPQFSGDPILWCGQDSLMALQLNLESTQPAVTQAVAGSTTTTQNPELHISTSHQQNKESGNEKAEAFSVPEIHSNIPTSPPLSPVSHRNSYLNREMNDWNGNRNRTSTNSPEKGQRNYRDAPHEKTDEATKSYILPADKENKSGIGNTIIAEEDDKEINTEKEQRLRKDESSNWRIVNWWKFDLGSTEWIKMPEVNISQETAELMTAGGCRTVDDGECVYILCPAPTGIPTRSSTGQSRQNLLSRIILLFDPKSVSIRLLGKISLNNAFRDRKVWQLGRSVFHALRSDNHTVIFLAYHKLLDLWIHDHQSNAVHAVENVWKGSSLHIFQRMTSFYKLSISLPSFRPEEEATIGKNYSFYMVNPRTKLFTFDDSQPAARFHITIVTDKSVFLPSRDASFFIRTANADTVVTKDANADKSFLSGNSTQIENISNTTATTTAASTTTAPTSPTSPTFTTTQNSTKNLSSTQSPTSAGSSPATLLLKTTPNNTILITTSLPATKSTKVTVDSKMTMKTNKVGIKLIPKLISKWKTQSSSYVNSTPSAKSMKLNSNFSVPVETSTFSRENNASHIPIATVTAKPLMLNSTTPRTERSTRRTTTTRTLEEKVGTNSSQRSAIEIGEWKRRLSWRSKSNLSWNYSHNETNNSVGLKPMGNVRVSTVLGTGASFPATTLNKKHILGIKRTFARVIDPAKRTKGNGKGLTIAQVTSLPANNERTSQSFATKSLSVGTRTNLKIPAATDAQQSNSNLTREHSSSAPQPQNVTVVANGRDLGLEETNSTATPKLISPSTTKTVSFTSTEMSGHERSLHSSTISTSTHEIAPLHSGTQSESDSDDSWSQARISLLQSDRKAEVGSRDDQPDEDDDQQEIVQEETEGPNMNYGPNVIEEVSSATTTVNVAGIMEDEDETGQNPLTYGSSEIMIESRDDIRTFGQEGPSASVSSYSSMLFFSISLTIFATFGVVLFFRRCVKCPPRRQSVLLKEPPPIQYSVIPDELSFRTPVI